MANMVVVSARNYQTPSRFLLPNLNYLYSHKLSPSFIGGREDKVVDEPARKVAQC
ncbi:lysosomal-trafficking regulator [Sesbania bispinosa]|nr:lysosomal-trafficking regulator [Sesbania bispinosa]